MKSWLDLSKIQAEPHQLEQLEIATSGGNLGILTGGPGTGKTYTIGQILKTFPGYAQVVALAGKAASRVREEFPQAYASTIHSALEPDRSGRDGDGWMFRRNQNFPLDAQLLICEESSMNDTRILCNLFQAVKRGTKVLMVGDPFQIAPVGVGRPFVDMINAGLPHGKLTELHRFAGRIAKVCKDIREQKRWQASEKLDLTAASPENFYHADIPCSKVSRTVKSYIEQFLSRGFSLDQIQVLSPCKDSGELSCRTMNTLIATWFNSQGEIIRSGNEKSKKEPADGAKLFRIGDKIICKRNQMIQKLPADGQSFEEAGKAYVANGDTGTIVEVKEFKRKLHVICRMLSSVIAVDFQDFKEDFWTAYCLTYHSTQGSQWPVVIPIIDDSNGAGMICDRSLHYTGDSRAGKVCCLVGPRVVHDMQCRTMNVKSRKTFLTEEIKKAIAG